MTDYQKDEFIKYEIQNIPADIKRHLPYDKQYGNLDNYISLYSKYLNDKETAVNYMKVADHVNKNIDDYMLHLIETGNDKFVISGIRFKMNKGSLVPFAEIYFKNFDLVNNYDLEELKKVIYEKYYSFDPAMMCFFERNYEFINDCRCETVLVTGHINTIKKMNKPEKYNEVLLTEINDFDFYDRYISEYESLKNENSIYENQVTAESKSTLKRAMKNGSVSKVFIDGQFAGLVAVARDRLFYCSGYYILEEILFKGFRGMNFGAALQRRLIEMLENDGHDFIFGTIVPDNTASMKTAEKCGRTGSGKYYFTNLQSKNQNE